MFLKRILSFFFLFGIVGNIIAEESKPQVPQPKVDEHSVPGSQG